MASKEVIPRRATLRSFVAGSLLMPAILSELMADESLDRAEHPPAPKKPRLNPTATRVIFLFSNSGVSHMDTFDPKPALFAADGKTKWIGGGLSHQQRVLLKPMWDFRPGAECVTRLPIDGLSWSCCQRIACLIR